MELHPCHLAAGRRTLVAPPWPSAPTTSTPSPTGASHRRRARRPGRRPRSSATTPTPAVGTDLGPSRLVAPRRTSRPGRPGTASWPARCRRRSPAGCPGALWSHQAEAHRPGPRRPLGRRRHGHRVGQVAAATRCRSPRRPPRRPAGHRRSSCSPPRRWPTTSCGRSPRSTCRGSWPAPTTATPARRSARGSASTPTSCSPTPRCSTPGCCRTTSGGPPSSAASATSWSTSSTRSAACSAATSPSSLRRLRRLARAPRRRPRRSSAARPPSASRSGWPSAVAASTCTPVLDDGSPRRPAHVALWQPPLLDAAPGARALRAPRGGRGHGRAHRRRPHHARVRRAAGGASRSWRPTCAAGCPARSAAGVRAYRGGYLAEERRDDRGRAVRRPAVRASSPPRRSSSASTSAGSTRSCSTASPARSPRSGSRPGGPAAREPPSAAVLVAGDDQLDQWLAAHPDELLARPPEPAVVNPANPFVLDPHLRCAAHELPLTHADERWWPGLLDDGVRRLVQADELAVRHRGRRQRADRGVDRRRVAVATAWACATRRARRCGSSPPTASARSATSTGPGPPSRCTPARPTSTRASTGGSSTLDLDAGVARVEPDDGATYTVPRSETAGPAARASTPSGRSARRACTSAPSRCTPRVVGYQRKDALTGARGRRPSRSTCPPSTLRHPRDLVRDRPRRGRPRRASTALGAAGRAARRRARRHRHAAAVRHLRPVGRRRACRRPARPTPALPTIVIYDAMPGGAGVAELGLRGGRPPPARPRSRASRRARATTAARRACSRPKCGNGNDPLDKAAAVALLRAILEP